MLFMCPGLITRIGRVVGAGHVGLSVFEVILMRRTPPEVLQASSVPAPRRDLLINMNFPPFKLCEVAAQKLVQTTYRKSIHYLEKIKALAPRMTAPGPSLSMASSRPRQGDAILEIQRLLKQVPVCHRCQAYRKDDFFLLRRVSA